jgi:predicted O-linked N-acetylglucosamine transferase (SPINDLY family)
MPRREGFLHRLQACDVALDTLHYGGGTTSLDAIAVGTPMVTFPSAFNRGRHTYAFLRKIGCTETVASSPEEYVDFAVRIGTDKDYRMYLTSRLTERAGALYEDRSAVEQIEAFIVGAMSASSNERDG